MALAEMVDRRRFNELLFANYEGISRDRLLILADEAFDSVIKRAIYPGARDLVQRCRAEGHDVVLVSGALDFLMERLAKYLGRDRASSPTASTSRTATPPGKLLRPVVAGPEKARLVREWATGHGAGPGRVLRLLRQLLRRSHALGRSATLRREPRRPPGPARADLRLAGRPPRQTRPGGDPHVWSACHDRPVLARLAVRGARCVASAALRSNGPSAPAPSAAIAPRARRRGRPPPGRHDRQAKRPARRLQRRPLLEVDLPVGSRVIYPRPPSMR